MWLLPLLAIGFAVAFVGSRERAPARPPGPLTLLGRCLQVGRQPPPQVILCAIAEAEELGRPDVAHGIVQTFVEPVVREHERRKALAAGQQRAAQAALPEHEQAELEALPEGEEDAIDVEALPEHAPLELAARAESDDDLAAALEMAAQLDREGRVPVMAQRYAAPEQRELALPAPVIAAEPRRARRSSTPLPQVPAGAWASFCDRLVRQAPSYQSERAVGQYHQRKERLAEIGIDYRRVLDDAAAQRAALDADLADAYKHVVAGGMLEHVGKSIAVPGREELVAVTLSGMLGVIQSAGLEAAANWLAHPKHRKRFPHTMAAFARTNGVF